MLEIDLMNGNLFTGASIVVEKAWPTRAPAGGQDRHLNVHRCSGRRNHTCVKSSDVGIVRALSLKRERKENDEYAGSGRPLRVEGAE